MSKIDSYTTGEVFKPGEVWSSPRGVLYTVEEVTVGGEALLRLGSNPGRGRLVRRDWDGAIGWRREGHTYNEAYPNYYEAGGAPSEKSPEQGGHE